MADGPVFVGGLGRSGKSLMCSLLASHPNMAMPLKETNLWTYFYRRYGDLGRPDNFERCLSAMLNYNGALQLRPNPARIRAEFRQGEATYARLFGLFHTHYAEQLGKPRWGVQALAEEAYTRLVLEAYPTAQIIQMIRDPRDRYEAKVTRRSGKWREVAIATATWLYSVGLAEHYQRKYPQRYKIVRYETLISQPEETIRDVCAFLHEDFAPAMFTGKNAFRYKGRVISTAFMGSFRQMMSKREIASMQAYSQQKMQAHNYELEAVNFSAGDYLLFHLLDQPVNLACIIGWRIHKNLQLKFPTVLGNNLLPSMIATSQAQ